MENSRAMTVLRIDNLGDFTRVTFSALNRDPVSIQVPTKDAEGVKVGDPYMIVTSATKA